MSAVISGGGVDDADGVDDGVDDADGVDDSGEGNAPLRDAQAMTVEALMVRVAELDDAWRRTAAELDNFRKRSARDVGAARADERARVTAALLPVLDNLDLALEHAEADPKSIVDGVRAIRQQAISALAALGYARRDDTGTPFDPTRHEAVAVVDDPDATPGTVVQVIRPGYGDGDRQLRPASVVVASGGG
jgi:molecular chaperone GrpE